MLNVYYITRNRKESGKNLQQKYRFQNLRFKTLFLAGIHAYHTPPVCGTQRGFGRLKILIFGFSK